MWQSDFIHWRLVDGTDVEVLNWLDDHSRYLLSCTAHRPVTGDDVVSVFLGLIERIRPASLDADRQRQRLHQPVHRRAQRVRIRPAATRHPPEERVPRAPPDPGQDRTVPPDPAALAQARPTARTIAELATASSISSASTTTNAAHTAPFNEEPRGRHTARPRRPPPPATGTRPATTACATTGSTPKAR